MFGIWQEIARLNWTIEVVCTFIATGLMVLSFNYSFKGHSQSQKKHTLYLLLCWGFIGFWALFQGLAFLLLIPWLFRIAVYFVIPATYFAILFFDVNTRESFDPIKIGIASVLSALTVYSSLDPLAVQSYQFENGEWSLLLAGQFRTFALLTGLCLGSIILYNFFRIYQNARQAQKKYALINLSGGLLIGILSPISSLLEFSIVLPGIHMVINSLGAIFCAYAFWKSPELAYALPFNDHNPNLLFRVTHDGYILYNHKASKNLKINWHFLRNKVLAQGYLSLIKEAINTGLIKYKEIEIDGFFASVIIEPMPNRQYAAVYVFDLTERKSIEPKNDQNFLGTDANIQKEVFLKEIHHRIKNQLQILAGIQFMQAENSNHPEIKEILYKSQNRIKSMALVHQYIYLNEDVSNITIRDYLFNLIEYLLEVYQKSEVINVEIKGGINTFPMEKVIPLGIITTELFTNSIKYAFPNQSTGSVLITINTLKSNQTLFTYHDSGIGLPKSFTHTNSNTLGMELIDMMVKQINGQLEIENTVGTTFQILFS